jgi:hypothetical protein
MIAILVLPLGRTGAVGVFAAICQVRWYLTVALLVVLAWMIVRWFEREELSG